MTSPTAKASIEAYEALLSAQTAFDATPASDPDSDAMGEALMAAYGAIDEMDVGTREGVFVRIAAGLRQAATACPMEESGVDFHRLFLLLPKLAPASL